MNRLEQSQHIAARKDTMGRRVARNCATTEVDRRLVLCGRFAALACNRSRAGEGSASPRTASLQSSPVERRHQTATSAWR